MKCCYDFEVGGVKGVFSEDCGYFYNDIFSVIRGYFDNEYVSLTVEDFLRHNNVDYFKYVLSRKNYMMHYQYCGKVEMAYLTNIVHDTYFDYKPIRKRNIIHDDGVLYLVGDKDNVVITDYTPLKAICNTELVELVFYCKLALNRKSGKQYKVKSRLRVF